MSNTYLNVLWGQSPYRGATRLVHLALADRADADGICWPSHDDLAARAECTTRTVQTALRALVDDGWVMVVKAKKRVVRGHSRTVYKLADPCGQMVLAPEMVSGVDTGKEVRHRKSARATPEICDAHIGEPPTEPSVFTANEFSSGVVGCGETRVITMPPQRVASMRDTAKALGAIRVGLRRESVSAA